jgi:citrate lyase subunit beta/citryl-CoA lyase
LTFRIICEPAVEEVAKVSDRAIPYWRSILFVPALVDRFIEKAPDIGADAIQIDLEDAVALSDKSAARLRLPDVVKRVARRGADVIVRINRPWRMAIADLEAAVVRGVSTITLPKVESADHVRAVDEIVIELEQERGLPIGGISLLLMIEGPGALCGDAGREGNHRTTCAGFVGSVCLFCPSGRVRSPNVLDKFF